MIVPAQAIRVVIAAKPVDFRKGHDGLAAIVARNLGLDPHLGLIVFGGRSVRWKARFSRLAPLEAGRQDQDPALGR